MWKRLDEQISLSEKHSKLTWEAFGIWIYILSNSDARGRFSGDSRVIKARCMTYRDGVRLEQVEDALSELERERVLHLYHVGQRRYVQIHDHDSWNPPGALRYQDPKHPAPPQELCECVRRECGVKTPLVSSPSSSLSTSSSASEGVQGEPPTSPLPSTPAATSPRDEVLRQLFQLATNQKIAATPSTLRTRLDAWVARLGASEVQARLMDRSCVGRTVNELQDAWFPKVFQKAVAPAPKSYKCGTCQDTGSAVIKHADGKPVYGPCSCKRRASGA